MACPVQSLKRETEMEMRSKKVVYGEKIIQTYSTIADRHPAATGKAEAAAPHRDFSRDVCKGCSQSASALQPLTGL
jgi:hypothetical protein